MIEEEKIPTNFVKNEIAKIEKRLFSVRIVVFALAYTGITLWLNSIRANATLWFLWFLIIIQFSFYFSIFIASYKRALVCGMNKNIGMVVFAIIAILGRINNWELIIIPGTIVVMLFFSIKTKKDSPPKCGI